MIIYEGPSEIDGAPIVVLATGIEGKSANAKTGAMIQTWILRSDIAPTDAARTGADASICGQCPHRHYLGGACYVVVHNAPRSTWAAHKRGRHEPFDAAAFTGRIVRLGAYGDPAAVPAHVWETVLQHAAGWTGYTHQWRTPQGAAVRRWCMASVDSSVEYTLARAAGWRTFRVRRRGQPIRRGEFVCPASEEAGKQRTCETCQACDGAGERPGRASPVINVHGSLKGRLRVLA